MSLACTFLVVSTPSAIAHAGGGAVDAADLPALPAPHDAPGSRVTSNGIALAAWQTRDGHLHFESTLRAPAWLVVGVERSDEAEKPLGEGQMPVNVFEAVVAHVDAQGTVTLTTGRVTQFDGSRMHEAPSALHLPASARDGAAGIFQRDDLPRFDVGGAAVPGEGGFNVSVSLPASAAGLPPDTSAHVVAYRGGGAGFPDALYLHQAAEAESAFRLVPAPTEAAFAHATAPAAKSAEAERDAGVLPAWAPAAARAVGGIALVGAAVALAVRAGPSLCPVLDALFAPRNRKRALTALALAVILMAPIAAVPAAAAPTAGDSVREARERVPDAGPPRDPCNGNGRVRHYNVSAIQVDIIYNRWGDHDPNGHMYVLDEHIDDVRAEERRLHRAKREGTLEEEFPTGAEHSFITPLVLRVAQGECLEIKFTNRLDPDRNRQNASRGPNRTVDHVPLPDPDRVKLRASVHVHGLPVDPQADGTAAVGLNPDSSVPPGGTRTYRYGAPFEGSFFMHDHGDPTHGGHTQFPSLPSQFIGSNTHGLFGMVIVEPAGATWTSPFTGEPLTSDWRADVHVPGERSFREFVIFYHDPQLEAPDGGEVPQPSTNHALNYRVETLSRRLLFDDHRCPPGAAAENNGVNPCRDPSLVYSSNVHGDPGTPLPRAYMGDPVRFRVAAAGTEEAHVHHIHGHRWRAVDEREEATRIDSQLTNPQETWTQTFEAGAGGQAEALAPGDYMFHCHLIPHLYGGMWGIFRVHDRLAENLEPLPSEPEPPRPTPQDPGFPGFMMQAMERGTRPPLAPQEPGRDPRTGLPVPAAGAPYADPCPEDAPVRRYHLVTILANISVNDHGDFVEDAVVYAFAEDAPAIERGERNPDPVVLRMRSGECIVIKLENRLPSPDPGDHPVLIEGKISIHSHLLTYDVLGSDGTTTGWNYEQTIWPGEEITHRLFADVEARTVVWHSHTGPIDSFRGAYGATLVEPADAEWRNPETGGPIYTTGRDAGDGALDSVRDPATGKYADVWRADIIRRDEQDFREFFVSIQDHFPVRRANGTPYRPDPDPVSLEDDFGIMGANYRTEPLWHRVHAGPENLFNSRMHGDPATNLWEAYPGDPVVVRLHQVPYEELHTFILDGHRWRFGQRDPFSPLTNSFSVGITEAFNAWLECGAGGCAQAPGDYLYRGGAMDDLWPGMWGLFRVHGGMRDDLEPLPDTTPSFEPEPVCPPDADHRYYDIHAIQKESLYNAYGDHDPHGLAFVHASDLPAVRAGVKRMEPLVLRVTTGDCLHVNLTNDIPPGRIPHAHTDPQPTAGYVQPFLHPNVTTGELLRTRPYQPGDRVGFHAHILKYNVQESDGARVGFNSDTTVGPGETRTYTFWTDALPNVAVHVEDLGDILTNRHHGLWGGIVVEDVGAVSVDPSDGIAKKNLPVADVHLPNGSGQREAVLFQQSGIALWTPEGRPYPMRDLGEEGEESLGDEDEGPAEGVDEGEEDEGDAHGRALADRAARNAKGFVDAFSRASVRVRNVQHAAPGFHVHGVIDATPWRADVDLRGDVQRVHIEPGDERLLRADRTVRLTDETGRPFTNVEVVLDHRSGSETARTDRNGIARFDTRLVPETISTIRVPETGLRIPVRAGFDRDFHLDVRADRADFHEATRAANVAIHYLKDHGFPPAPAGVSGVDVTGSVWRVRADDALRIYDLQIAPYRHAVADFVFEARATPAGLPAFVPERDIVTAARNFIREHYGEDPGQPLSARRDRFGTWRVEFDEPTGHGTASVATSLRLDGQTARVLAFARAPADAAEAHAPLPGGPVHLRVRAEGGATTEGELVLVFRDGRLTGQIQLQTGGRTVLSREDAGHATHPGDADVKIPHLGFGFPIEVRGGEFVTIDIDGARATTNVKPMIAVREAAQFFERLRPHDFAGNAPWGLNGLHLGGDGAWHVALVNQQYRLDVRVDSATGEILSATLRPWVSPVDDCSGQPLEHFGPHSAPECPSSFSFVDEEDQGMRGFNYRSEPYENRLVRVPDPALVHSTLAHREPATPIIRAHPGDPITLHLLGVQEKGRLDAFSLSGHAWSQNPVFLNTLHPPEGMAAGIDSADGVIVAQEERVFPVTGGTLRQAEGGIGFYRNFRLGLLGGAGGFTGLEGDYYYQGSLERFATPMGEWGFLRVVPEGTPGVRSLSDPPRLTPREDAVDRSCKAPATLAVTLTIRSQSDGTLVLVPPGDGTINVAAGASLYLDVRLMDAWGKRVLALDLDLDFEVPWIEAAMNEAGALCVTLSPPKGDHAVGRTSLVVKARVDGAPASTTLTVIVHGEEKPWWHIPANPAVEVLAAVLAASLVWARRGRRAGGR